MINSYISVSKLYYLRFKWVDLTYPLTNPPVGGFSVTLLGNVWKNGTQIGTSASVILSYSNSGKSLSINGTSQTLVDSDLIEIYGTTTSVVSSGHVEIYRTKVSSFAIENPIAFNFCRISEREIVVNKTISDVTTIYGAMRDELDIINPVILVETNSELSLGIINYVYFNTTEITRYYYIRNIVCVRTNVYRITLHEDVLKTFEPLIENAPAFVTRSQSAGGNAGMVDDRLPLKDVPIIEFVDASPDSETYYINTRLKTKFTASDYSISMSMINSVATTYYDEIIAQQYDADLTIDLAGAITPYKFTNAMSVTYLMNYYKYAVVGAKVKSTSSLEGFLISAVSFPFLLGDDVMLDENDQWVNRAVGLDTTGIIDPATSVNMIAPLLKGDVGNYKTIGYLKIVNTNISGMIASTSPDRYFLNYEPYSQYDLFIPYVGWIKLNSHEIVGKTIRVFYIPDYITGLATANVMVQETHKIIYTNTIQLGTPLAVTRTNQEELTKQKQANANALALGLVSSAVSIGAGIATLNPIAVAGGVVGATASLVTFGNKNNMMIPNSSTRAGGESFDLFNGNKCIIKHTYREPIFAEDSDAEDIYLDDNGLPYNSGDTLDAFSGYTEVAQIELQTSKTINGVTYTLLKDEYDEIKSLVKAGIYL